MRLLITGATGFIGSAELARAALDRTLQLRGANHAARATGVVNAVVDGVTGILVSVGDSAGLSRALAQPLEKLALRSAMERAGHERVLQESVRR